MAYNFLCKTTVEPKWDKLNKALIKYDKLEKFPLINYKEGEYSLAISVPSKNAGREAYRQFVSAYKLLTGKFKFAIMDMYHGKIIDDIHLKSLSNEIG